MNLTLTFDMNKPEEEAKACFALKAEAMSRAIEEYENEIKRILRSTHLSEEDWYTIDGLRATWYAIKQKNLEET